MSTSTHTFDALADKFGITADSVTPAAERDGWGAGASHWSVTLRHEGDAETLTVPFSMGSAHTHTPSAGEVFHCLLLDAMSGDETFGDWCLNFGMDPQNDDAAEAFAAVQAQTAWLRAVLTDDELDVALDDATDL